jgi:hypothetical protein
MKLFRRGQDELSALEHRIEITRALRRVNDGVEAYLATIAMDEVIGMQWEIGDAERHEAPYSRGEQYEILEPKSHVKIIRPEAVHESNITEISTKF